MLSSDLISILCCPETKQELAVADASLVEKINQKIARGELKNRGGAAITQKIEGGLVRADKKYLYAIRQDIPLMLIDEAIPIAGIL
ncbi:MAG: Trm112 family protein [Candidatus Omnitrophota bacterium]